MSAIGRGVWTGAALAAVMCVPTPALADQPEHSEMVCTVGFESTFVENAQGEEVELLEPVTTCIHTEELGPSFEGSTDSLDLQIASRGCYYWGTKRTQWIDLGFTEGGEIRYGWSPNGVPGVHVLVGTARPCTWSTVESEEIEGYVWSRIGSYTHQAPQVSFNPAVTRGMVGINTFAALAVPLPWEYSSISPYTGRSLTADARVRQVRIDWDDGPPQSYRGPQLSRLTGYPDGVASHTYQTKSCESARRRCRQHLGAYEIETSFVWSGWFRVSGRTTNLSVPDTSTSTAYPVSETISLVVG